MSKNSVLAVAFDGLDKELIDEFELEHIKQSEYGSLDNQTGISQVMTNELYASFITGTTFEEHGIEGLKKDLTPVRSKIIDALTPGILVQNVRGFDFLRRNLLGIFRTESRDYFKDDLKKETLFEEIDNSRAMFVPSYNPSMVWAMMGFGTPLTRGYSQEEILEVWDNEEHEYRKRKLFSELENEIIPARDFLMCHFHRPDTHQHFYTRKYANATQEGKNYDKSKLKKVYQETDQLAKEIKEKATEKGYDILIFLSDHGMPTETEHNENAFYSCNKRLFCDKTPKINEFHDKITKLLED